jgi:hypothetical protein
MLRLLRFALLVVLAFLALGMVVAIATPETGPIEKIALGVMLAGVFVVAAPVRRIGLHHS